jgi:glutathione synthase/RimK-type ligase-like ATP-grasp enzyme
MIALVTCEAARDLDDDLPLLGAALPESTVVVWDDQDVDWGTFDVVIIRSAWDYHLRHEAFLGWARRVESLTHLWNPVDVITWNTDKRYLAGLERSGVPTVPTAFVAPGSDTHGLELGGDIVVKPSVGAGSNGVFRARGDSRAARCHIDELLAAGRTAMVQPYQIDVETRGETGLVYLAGEYSHAFTKSAILAAPVTWEADLVAEEQIAPHRAEPAERRLGDQVIDLLPATAYARIDLLPTADGPVVLEVEVTEPSLYLRFDPGAPARAASAFRSLVA